MGPSVANDEKPFRTAAIVLPEANQSIYGDGHVGHKYVTTSGENEEKPFRTAPIILSEAKSIYGDGHAGHKYVTNSGEMEEAPFRNSSLGPAAPRTILEYSWQKGGPLYQPFKETPKIS